MKFYLKLTLKYEYVSQCCQLSITQDCISCIVLSLSGVFKFGIFEVFTGSDREHEQMLVGS